MAEWQVQFEPAIQEFVDSLSDDEQHQVQRRLQNLREFGPSIQATGWARHIEKGLCELRARCRHVCIRLFYFQSGKTFIAVHAFKKKTNRTPRREIDVAFARMRNRQPGR